MKIILNGRNTLKERFADIDEKLVGQEMYKSERHQGIPGRIKSIERV